MNYKTQRELVCEHEHILTSNLSICKANIKCPYLHPINSIYYCKKYKCIRDAEQTFQREKSRLERDILGDAL